MRDLYIASDEIVVSLDPSEIRLIDRALHCLRYSNEPMTGSQLVNLAGLSGEWRALTQDHAAERYHDMRPKTALALVAGVEMLTHETD